MKCDNGLMFMEFTSLDLSPANPHTESAGFIEWCNDLLKNQLQCQLSGNTLQGWSKFLQMAAYALNQHSIYDAVSPIARIHESRNHGVEIEVEPFIIPPSDPVAKILLPVPTTLYSAGLEVLVPERGMLSPGDTTVIPLN